jgi:magnesium transporter
MVTRRHGRTGSSHFRTRVLRTKRPPAGSGPGALVADPNSEPSNIEIIQYGPDGFREQPVENAQELTGMLAEYPVSWVNIWGLASLDVIRQLAQQFGFHRLAVEDVVNVDQRAKVESHRDYLFAVNRLPSLQPDGSLEAEQVSFFLREGLVVTFQERKGDCFDTVRKRIREGQGRIRTEGADYLLYALLDAVTDSYYPILEHFGERLEALNEAIMETPHQVTPAQLHAARHDLLFLRRAIWPQRELFNVLAREKPDFIDDVAAFHFRDCYDHAVQLLEIVETYREIAGSSVELYFASINLKINDVMKVLTIIATIFIPMSFVASLYGMNFDTSISPTNMPELKWRYGYIFSLIVMGAIATGFIIYFWLRGWLGGRDRLKR